jgi:hypothetical protein
MTLGMERSPRGAVGVGIGASLNPWCGLHKGYTCSMGQIMNTKNC